jgi:predicted aconitase with swiveling domain
VTGRVLAMTSGRGSSSSSSVLAEQIRAGTAPAAVLLAVPDVILALGAIVAAELYGTSVPIVALAPEDFAGLASAPAGKVLVTVHAPEHGTGSVHLVRSP